jgi:hypothetical protein
MESIHTITIEPATFGYDVKSDGLYKLGFEEGFEEGLKIGRHKATTSLLKRFLVNDPWMYCNKSPFEKIANIVELDQAQVETIALDLLQNEGQTEAEALVTIEQYKSDYPVDE